MLEACHGEWGKVHPPSYAPLTLDELHALVDRLAAAPPVSSYGGGACGDHAWLSVIDCGFVLHAYFREDCRADGAVRFELYGPRQPGTEREHGDPSDRQGLAGRMIIASLKTLLTMLDRGHSPIDYARGAALSASVGADD